MNVSATSCPVRALGPARALSLQQPRRNPLATPAPGATRRPRVAPRPTRRAAAAAPRAALSVQQTQAMTMVHFNELLESSTTPAVLVDFYTTWCGPCKVLDKNMKPIEKAHRDNVSFHKIDTEVHPEVADHFGIQKLPTLVLFKAGVQVARYEGLISGQDLDMWLRAKLK